MDDLDNVQRTWVRSRDALGPSCICLEGQMRETCVIMIVAGSWREVASGDERAETQVQFYHRDATPNLIL